jgi:hypothetical protein
MEPQEILRKLVDKFRWKWEGYGKVSCPSCGAIAYRDFGDNDIPPSFSRIDQCSISCPWRLAEEYLEVNK